MQITKEIFDQIKPGEIFRQVTTKFHAFLDIASFELTFVCVKGKSGKDWAIYCERSGARPLDVARYSNKVMKEEVIRNICPCDDEVFQLYRQ